MSESPATEAESTVGTDGGPAPDHPAPDHPAPESTGAKGSGADKGAEQPPAVTTAPSDGEAVSDGEAGDAEGAASDETAPDDGGQGPSRLEQLEQEGDIAADYLEELLDIADLDGDIDMDVEGDRAAVSIVGGDLSVLVGHDGQVLEALQELTRLAVHAETGQRSWLMLDIGRFRAERRSELEKLAGEVVERVRETGEPESLRPMTPFERKVVHDAVAAAGLTSESEGVGADRHVVVSPA